MFSCFLVPKACKVVQIWCTEHWLCLKADGMNAPTNFSHPPWSVFKSNKKRPFSVHCGVEDRKSSLENRWAISMIQLCCAHRRKDHDLGNDRVLAWKVAINHHSELNNSCCFLKLKLRNQQSPIFQMVVMKCLISVICVKIWFFRTSKVYMYFLRRPQKLAKSSLWI